jgi:uncharacterized membrane protein HdeD (DUF308 family)
MESNRGPEENRPEEMRPIEQQPMEQRPMEQRPMREPMRACPPPERHQNWLVIVASIILILLGGLNALVGLGTDFVTLLIGLVILVVGAVLLYEAIRTPRTTATS